MVRKAQQSSAGGARGWPFAAALLACIPILLASATDAAVAALPSVAAIPSTTQRAADDPGVAATPLREAAGHPVAAVSAEGSPAAPGAGATNSAGHSAQLTASEATHAVETATQVPSAAAAGAAGLTAVAKAIPAVEHAATGAGQLTKDLAAAAESSGDQPRRLLGSAARAAGGLGQATSRRPRIVESSVSGPISHLKSAARPAADGVPGPPSHHSAGPGGGGLRLGTVASAPARPGAAPLAAARAQVAAATAGRYPTLVPAPSATAPVGLGRPAQRVNGLGPIDPRVSTSVPGFGPLLTSTARLSAGADHRRGAPGAVARMPGPAGTGPIPAPSGGPGSVAGGYGAAFSMFLALAGFLLIALVGAMRRLRLCGEPWRAAQFVLIPERPG
jgi:serine-type D-Ala-D-Ala carboxypeptidase (penicillin-binding protein 5/6)